MLTFLTSIWPYVLLILLVAWQAAAVGSLALSLAGAAGATALVTLLHATLVGAPAGHTIKDTAIFALASSLPFLGAAISSYLAGRRSAEATALVLGVVVGVALLAPMLLMRLTQP